LTTYLYPNDNLFFMNNSVKQKIKNVSEDVEIGIRELGEQEDINIQATTFFSERKGYLPPSIYVMQRFALLFSEKVILNVSTYRVVFHFMALTQFENKIQIDILTICENLDLNKSTVIKALNTLVKLNIVMKYPSLNDKRRHDYIMNPYTMWKGKSSNRSKSIKKYEKHNPSILELPFNDDKRL